MSPEIPVSRGIIENLNTWISVFAAPFLPLVQVPREGGGFRWTFREERPETLMIGKAVRMVSGIKAALFLADNGFTTECASLLRMVSDFSKEITAVAEGLLNDRLREPQERFVRQYFTPLARTPEEYEERNRERHVSREELFRAQRRLAERAQVDPAEMRRQVRYLNYVYDQYVHGAYSTAMELYDGRTNRFVLDGHEAEEPKEVARTAVAGKLHEVITALHIMALMSDNTDLRQEIMEARRALDASGEY
jgi:hypothetical protein